MKLRYGLSLVALVLGAVACGGTAAKSATSSPSPTPTTRARGRGANGVAGTVASVNGSTFIVNLRTGGSATVDASSATVVMKTVTTTLSALAPNTTVVVSGPMNADGTYTANAITITPLGGGGGFGGFGGGGGGGFGGLGGGGGTFSPRPRASGGLGAGRARAAAGTVTSVKGADVYLQTAAGASIEAITSPSTVVSETQTGSLSDVTIGTTVTVVGTQGSDGAYSATRIIIGNLGLGGGGFFGGGGFGGLGGGGGSGA